MIFDDNYRLPAWSRGSLFRLFKQWYAKARRLHVRAHKGSATEGELLDWARAMLPDHFRLTPSGMHVWLAVQLDAMRLERGTKLNLIGPRGSAKSTVATLAYVLRAAAEAFEPYVWIVSDTKHQACAHLENIKSELVDNGLLATRYPRPPLASGRCGARGQLCSPIA